MVTAGFFRNETGTNFDNWISDQNVKFVQYQVAMRLKQKYLEYIEVPHDRVRSMIIHTLDTWRAPLSQDELLEMVICDFVKDIDTDIEWRNRFNDYNPRTLYFPGTDITREEKVKLNPGYKWEFQMNY